MNEWSEKVNQIGVGWVKLVLINIQAIKFQSSNLQIGGRFQIG